MLIDRQTDVDQQQPQVCYRSVLVPDPFLAGHTVTGGSNSENWTVNYSCGYVDMFAAIAIGYITSSCHSGSRSDCGSNMAAPPLGRTMHRSSRSLNRREQATVSLLVWANSSGWDQSARQCSSHSKYDKLLFLECRDSLTKKLHGKYTGIAHQSLMQPRYLNDPLGFRWSSSP